MSWLPPAARAALAAKAISETVRAVVFMTSLLGAGLRDGNLKTRRGDCQANAKARPMGHNPQRKPAKHAQAKRRAARVAAIIFACDASATCPIDLHRRYSSVDRRNEARDC